jgi:hypothetical protein
MFQEIFRRSLTGITPFLYLGHPLVVHRLHRECLIHILVLLVLSFVDGWIG